jgi:maltose/moltooligosaccharide transporter
MKLDYGKTFLLGFGFFGISMVWAIYNSYVPVFLARDFGLAAAAVGVVMTFDNIAALFIQPVIGVFSDATRTRLGRRMPYLLVGAPIAALAFVFVPLAPALPLLMVSVRVVLLAMAVFRTPTVALMPDITPSPLRSKANAVINVMGGLAALLAFFVGSKLYDMGRPVPFWVASLLLVVAVAIVLWKIREPKEYTEAAAEKVSPFRDLRQVWKEGGSSAMLLLGAIFFWFLGYNAIEAFFTLYGVNVLGIKESAASFMLGYMALTFLIFAIPSGFIATRFGRKRTIMAGIVVMILALTAGAITPNATVITVVLIVTGLGWALININSLPMVVDIASDALAGTFTGLYYLAATLAAIAGPVLAGSLIQASGDNYGLVFVLAPVSLALALVCMAGVHKGEAKAEIKVESGVA